MADPEPIADQSRYQDVTRRYRELEQLVTRSRELRQRTDDLETAKEMLTDLDGDDREVMRLEVSEAEADIERLEAELKILLLPKDPNEGKHRSEEHTSELKSLMRNSYAVV